MDADLFEEFSRDFLSAVDLYDQRALRQWILKRVGPHPAPFLNAWGVTAIAAHMRHQPLLEMCMSVSGVRVDTRASPPPVGVWRTLPELAGMSAVDVWLDQERAGGPITRLSKSLGWWLVFRSLDVIDNLDAFMHGQVDFVYGRLVGGEEEERAARAQRLREHIEDNPDMLAYLFCREHPSVDDLEELRERVMDKEEIPRRDEPGGPPVWMKPPCRTRVPRETPRPYWTQNALTRGWFKRFSVDGCLYPEHPPSFEDAETFCTPLKDVLGLARKYQREHGVPGAPIRTPREQLAARSSESEVSEALPQTLPDWDWGLEPETDPLEPLLTMRRAAAESDLRKYLALYHVFATREVSSWDTEFLSAALRSEDGGTFEGFPPSRWGTGGTRRGLQKTFVSTAEDHDKPLVAYEQEVVKGLEGPYFQTPFDPQSTVQVSLSLVRYAGTRLYEQRKREIAELARRGEEDTP